MMGKPCSPQPRRVISCGHHFASFGLLWVVESRKRLSDHLLALVAVAHLGLVLCGNINFPSWAARNGDEPETEKVARRQQPLIEKLTHPIAGTVEQKAACRCHSVSGEPSLLRPAGNNHAISLLGDVPAVSSDFSRLTSANTRNKHEQIVVGCAVPCRELLLPLGFWIQGQQPRFAQTHRGSAPVFQKVFPEPYDVHTVNFQPFVLIQPCCIRVWLPVHHAAPSVAKPLSQTSACVATTLRTNSCRLLGRTALSGRLLTSDTVHMYELC